MYALICLFGTLKTKNDEKQIDDCAMGEALILTSAPWELHESGA